MNLSSVAMFGCRDKGSSAWHWTFNVQEPAQFDQFPGLILSEVPVQTGPLDGFHACLRWSHGTNSRCERTCGFGSDAIFYPGHTLSFSAGEGEGFVVSGFLRDIDCSADGTSRTFSKSFRFQEAYSYGDITGFKAVTENLGPTDGCHVEVTFEISSD